MRAVQPGRELGTARGGVRRLPRPARTGLADLRAWRRARRLRELAGMVADRPYRLVMQLHRRFHDCGFEVAREAGVPLVLRVDALEVREEATWGVRRPGWGRIVEQLGEVSLLRRADLVAAVSDDIDEALATLGIEDERRVVVPSGVDLDAMTPGEDELELRRRNGLDGRFVVGWVGGFRPFHGLEAIPDIARGLRRSVPDAVLCLVGTGPLRGLVAERIEGSRTSCGSSIPSPTARFRDGSDPSTSACFSRPTGRSTIRRSSCTSTWHAGGRSWRRDSVRWRACSRMAEMPSSFRRGVRLPSWRPSRAWPPSLRSARGDRCAGTSDRGTDGSWGARAATTAGRGRGAGGC